MAKQIEVFQVKAGAFARFFATKAKAHAFAVALNESTGLGVEISSIKLPDDALTAIVVSS